jgi:hypothetical protein
MPTTPILTRTPPTPERIRALARDLSLAEGIERQAQTDYEAAGKNRDGATSLAFKVRQDFDAEVTRGDILAMLTNVPESSYAYNTALVYGGDQITRREFAATSGRFVHYHNIARHHRYMEAGTTPPMPVNPDLVCIINLGTPLRFPSHLDHLPLFVLPL